MISEKSMANLNAWKMKSVSFGTSIKEEMGVEDITDHGDVKQFNTKLYPSPVRTSQNNMPNAWTLKDDIDKKLR